MLCNISLGSLSSQYGCTPLAGGAVIHVSRHPLNGGVRVTPNRFESRTCVSDNRYQHHALHFSAGQAMATKEFLIAGLLYCAARELLMEFHSSKKKTKKAFFRACRKTTEFEMKTLQTGFPSRAQVLMIAAGRGEELCVGV